MDIVLQPARGQIMVLFALMLTVLFGMVGLAIDLAHVRAVAEEAQRAADAGALAGVVYLPGDPANAQSKAAFVSTANGFTDTGPGGASHISYVTVAPLRRLTETITTTVSTPFLRVIGRGSMTVTRSATATYDDPINMGAPDHVLGYAPYPTTAFNGQAGAAGKLYPQGFYLQDKGPYDGLEHGDAFSPYFMTYSNGHDHQANTVGTEHTYNDPCTSSTSSPSYFNDVCTDAGTTTQATLLHNPYFDGENAGTQNHGYNFEIQLPPNMDHPVLIKVLDPLDECSDPYTSHGYDANAGHYSTVLGPLSGTSSSSPTTIRESTMLLDQCDWANYIDSFRPTTLKFTVMAPSPRVADNTSPVTPTAPNVPVTVPGAYAVAVGPNPLYAGPEFATSTVNGHPIGAHAFQWLTIARVQNLAAVTQYMRISVESVMNNVYDTTAPCYNPGTRTWTAASANPPYCPGGTEQYGSADSSTFGAGGNVYGLGICDAGGYTDGKGNVAEADPGVYGSMFDTGQVDWKAADTGGANPDLNCVDPNTDGVTNFAASVAASGSRFQVNGREAMCIITLFSVPSGQSAATAYIPLAEIGPHFAGSDVTLRLYDPGDISGANNFLSIMGPGDDPSDPNFLSGSYTPTDGEPVTAPAAWRFESEPYRLDVSSPPIQANFPQSGGQPVGYSPRGNGRPGSTSGGQTSPGTWCGTDYDAWTPPAGNAAQCPYASASPPFSTEAVHVANPSLSPNNVFANDTWLQFHVRIPSNYTPAAGQDWWKVAYHLVGASGTAYDTTTWQVLSGDAPVHLIVGQ